MNNEIEIIRSAIENGRTAVGIELGSTRIKTVMIGENNDPVASGDYTWENSLVDGVWTYSLEEIWKGLQESYRAMTVDVREKYGVPVKNVGAIGVSAMMHGYLAFDKDGELLVPFRTWRNTITGEASEELTKLFDYPIPQRWSIAHLYQAILNGEEHVSKIDFMTTLAGYVHWKLTGRRVLGVGDASGMFPIEKALKDYQGKLVKKFEKLIAPKKYPWRLKAILPEVLLAGEDAGTLTSEGAKLLDPSGALAAGIPLCPPEGDAGTGMTATNSIAVRTGNISAGTSVFAMIVLEKELTRAYSEIDLVTTPVGDLVAMAHSNNCSSDYDAWIRLLEETLRTFGVEVSKTKLYETLFNLALKGDPDCGGLLSYGYISGEHITHFEEGRPLFTRSQDSRFNLANFMRVNLFTALGALRTGLDILFEKEGVKVDEIKGHGGFFKTKTVGQRIVAAATHTPISVVETAGEGGAWGIALLAAYMKNKMENETLEAFLGAHVFRGKVRSVVEPNAADEKGFNTFMERYRKGLAIERAAVENLD